MATPEMAAQLKRMYPNLEVLEHRSLAVLQTKLRDEKTPHVQFKQLADRIMNILAEEGLASCASKTITVRTPTGDTFTGLAPAEEVCAVSIVRAGDSLLQAVIDCDPSVSAGKILIQRDEESEDKHPIMFYSKLPPKISSFENVMLVDPMLGTGGSVKMAIQTLLQAGVQEHRITFLNVLACPEGLDALFTAYPDVKVVTAGLERGLNADVYAVPGVGDFGDRYFNTV